MGLTKPRAYQIFDIDYKQAVRVITLTNITLSGGAPSTVDGVSLSVGSRILVAGQSTGSQNGLYQVSVVGTGSNGTWIRSVDTNESGELNAGTIVMVTEGTTYKDTQWKLTTNDPIVIGTTALVFEQNSAFAFGNIYANSTAVLADIVGDTVTFTPANNMIILANATSDTITFEVSQSPNFTGNFQVSGTVGSNLIPSANLVYNLGNTTNRWNDIWLANSTIYLGNAQISANATSLILTTPQGAQTVLSGTTANVAAAAVTATGNITGGNLITSGVLSVTGNANVGNLGTAGEITATGNITSAGNITVGNAVFTTSNSAIQGWSYNNVNLSITATEGTPQGLFFGNSGASFYVVGSATDRVYQYNMSTVNMANTGVLLGNVSVASQDSSPADLYIDSTGANLYIMGGTNDTVYQYSMSTPWNITTATYTNRSFSVTTQEATPQGIWFKPDLTTMYVVGNTNDTVYQYSLSSAGNVATASYASKSFSVTTQSGTPVAVQLSTDGSTMWILSQDQDAVFEYNLSTPWDVSTASYTAGRAFGFWAQGETSSLGLFVDIGNSRAWIVGSANDTVYQYDTLGSVLLRGNAIGTQSSLTVGGNAYVAGRLQVDQAARFESSLTVDSTITATSTLSLTGTSTGSMALGTSITTANANIFTSQTTGNFLIGGTAATGTINIGRSTANQSILIGNGITASGSVKTIDIGTLGASGSNTNITIGSATSGAVTTTTIYGNATIGNISTGGVLSVTGNANVGNIGATNANLTALTTSGNVTAGGISTAGNVSASYFLGNVACAAGIFTTKIFSGNTEINIPSANGNANITIGGVSNVAVFSTAGANITGTLGVSGNITGGNVSGTLLTGTLATAAQPNVTSVGTLTSLSVSGNANAGNVGGTRAVFSTVVGTLETAAQPNVTSVGTLTSLSVTGNISSGNVSGTLITGTLTTAAQPNVTSVGTLTGLSISGNLSVAGNVAITGNVNYANVTDLVVGDPLVFLGANNTSNVVDLGFIVTYDDGLDQHGGWVRDASDGTWKLFGNVVPEPTTTVNFSNAIYQPMLSGSITSTGIVSAVGNVIGANVISNALLSGATLSVSGNANVGNIGGTSAVFTNITGTLATAAQPNVTSVGTLTSLSVSGNANVGNLGTVGLVVASGNVTGGNINSAGTGVFQGNVRFGGEANTQNSGFIGWSSVDQFGFVSEFLNAVLIRNEQTTNEQTIYLGDTSPGNPNTLFGIASGAGNGTAVLTLTGTGNLTVANVTPTGVVNAIGNVTGSNLNTAGNANITGNVSAGNILLSGNIFDSGTSLQINTTTAANISLAPNQTIVLTATTTGANITGTLNATGNANVGNLGTAGLIVATGNVTSGNVVTAGQVTATGNVNGNFITGNGSALTGINAFGTIVVAGSDNVVADSTADTLTLVAGDGVVITTSAGTDTITISTSGSSESIFITGGDMGTVDELVTQEQDLGPITEVVDTEIDMGQIVTAGVFYPDQIVFPSYTVAQLANLSAVPAGQMVYCSNESGGAVPAFSDGTNWRRVTDRAIVT